MLHSKQHITDLAEICYRKGIEYIIISPGSRNAPLISAFVKRFGNKCISIVDERSAGYFSIGLARTKRTPVILISTSGTAVLNYGPSLAEAYYQHVPVLAVTADRPIEWIDQQDNQTIRQNEVLKNYVKSSYQLPQEIETNESLSDAHNIIISAIKDTLFEQPGSVHLNVPLDEPLYDPLPEVSGNLPNSEIRINTEQNFSLTEELKAQWLEAERIMIIHGHSFPDDRVGQSFQKISLDPRVVIIAENISNCTGPEIISSPELLLAHHSDQLKLIPDLLIYSAGQIVSKRLKTYLRNQKIKNTWRIGIDDFPIDTFKKNNQIVKMSSYQFYPELAHNINQKGDTDYKNLWLRLSLFCLSNLKSILPGLPFCDLKAFEIIFECIPSNIILELGNSSVIRYAQLFKSRPGLVYYSNRGVSGIDGCLSTAAGTAYASDRLTLSILGDLSFVYDSNALWNHQLPKNLRIIVINNSGGDIFNLIEGTANQPEIKQYQIAHHPASIQKLAEAFNLDYFCCQNEEELRDQLSRFFIPGSKASLLEIKTSPEENATYFQQIMSKKSSSEITK